MHSIYSVEIVNSVSIKSVMVIGMFSVMSVDIKNSNEEFIGWPRNVKMLMVTNDAPMPPSKKVILAGGYTVSVNLMPSMVIGRVPCQLNYG